MPSLKEDKYFSSGNGWKISCVIFTEQFDRKHMIICKLLSHMPNVVDFPFHTYGCIRNSFVIKLATKQLMSASHRNTELPFLDIYHCWHGSDYFQEFMLGNQLSDWAWLNFCVYKVRYSSFSCVRLFYLSIANLLGLCCVNELFVTAQ